MKTRPEMDAKAKDLLIELRTQHTPPPWHVGMRPGPIVYGSLGEQIADCRAMVVSGEAGRNANLIAAAPELLEAVKDYAKLIHAHSPCNGKMLCRPCQLVAKAEGK